MKPINFKESNKILKAPEGLENCGDLYVYTNGEQNVSCWQPTEEERRQINEGKPVWLSVIFRGGTQPPVALTTEYPFIQEEEIEWNGIEQHLNEMIDAYQDIGTAGLFVLATYLIPYKRRFEAGERTSKLAKEIMAVS